MKYLLYFFLFFGLQTKAQIKALIWDFESGHASSVASVFESAYGCTNCTIVSLGSQSDVNTIIANNPSIGVIIRSTSGYDSYTGFARDQWKEERFMCMPYGSNSSVRGSDISKGKIIITGSGALDMGNETQFGSQLDFWDLPTGAISNNSSRSNAVIAAKLLKIKDKTGYSNEIVLKAAKLSADEEVIRTDRQGYGRINVSYAVSLLSETRVTNRSFAQNTHLVFDEDFRANTESYQLIDASVLSPRVNIENGWVEIDMTAAVSNKNVFLDCAIYEEKDEITLFITKSTPNVTLTSLNGNIRRWAGTGFFSSNSYINIPFQSNQRTLRLRFDGTDLVVIGEY